MICIPCAKQRAIERQKNNTITDLGCGDGRSLKAAFDRWQPAKFHCLGIDLDPANEPSVSPPFYFWAGDITSSAMQWVRRGYYVAHGILDLLEPAAAVAIATRMVELADYGAWIRVPDGYDFGPIDWAVQEAMGERSGRLVVDLIDGQVDCLVLF